MRKIASAAVATVLAGVMAMPLPAEAASMNFRHNDRVSADQCMANQRACWVPARHNRHHRHHRHWRGWDGPNPGNFAAGIFGFAVGAALASGLERDRNITYDRGYYYNHVAACEARYRSYDPRTDTFLGYDGRRHLCRL